MLSICCICLSTDRTLQVIKEPLSKWHDELCDCAVDDCSLYCFECSHLLNKFHSFKQKCLQANVILQKWRQQNPEVRPQLHKLKRKIPQLLSISKSTNHKIYFYEAQNTVSQNLSNAQVTGINTGFYIDTLTAPASNSDVLILNIPITNIDGPTPILIEIPSEHNPENVSSTNQNIELKDEACNDNHSFKGFKVKIEDELLNTEVVGELNVINDIKSDLKDNHDNVINNRNDRDFYDQKLEVSSCDDSSDNEILIKKRKRTLREDSEKSPKKKVKHEKEDDVSLNKLKKTVKEKNRSIEKKKVKSRNKFNIESIKRNLLSKFGNKEVRDEDGNIIDKDSIINSLDKLHKKTLGKVEKHSSGSKPFSPEGIQLLSQVQKRYGNQYSSVFTTVHLATTEQVLEEFNRRREHESYLASEHRCTLCYRGFKYGTLLEYHMNEYHNSESRPHACHICQMRFKNAQGKRCHVRAHHVVYKCKLCPLVTNYRNVMETHFNQHNGVKLICDICKAELNSKTSLYNHMNCMHSAQYFCPVCARTFASENGVTCHMIRKHPKEETSEGPPSAKCELCNVTFLSDEVYRTHLSKSHSDKIPSYLNYKKRNITRKRQPPNMVCRVCKKVEHSLGKLKLHFKTEHPNETDTVSMCSDTLYSHLCHVCGKGFTNRGALEEHKNLHTGAKPYACDKCPKAFRAKVSLRFHLERHLPPTRECQHCGKKFRSSSNLNNHIKTHIGIKSYACELCDKSFLFRAALNEHVRGVHLRIRRARKHNKEPPE